MSYPESFQFIAPASVHFGLGLVDQLAALAASTGVKKPLVVTDPGLVKAGIADRVGGILEEGGLSPSLFSEVEENPRYQTMERAAQWGREQGCDGVIGLGGGSSMDTAKFVGVLWTNGGGVHDYIGIEKVKVDPAPIICVPTTSGTAAEVTRFAVPTVPTPKNKPAMGSWKIIPKLAVCDPGLTLSLPARVTAATGMDALTHALESYTNTVANPISDALSARAMQLVGRWLRTAVYQPGNREARYNMMLASLLAGMAFNITRLGNVHAMSHAVGGHFDVPHGVANAIILPRVMEYNLVADPVKYANVARFLGEDVEGLPARAAAEAAVEAVEALNRDLGIPESLRDVGVPEGSEEAMAADAMPSGNVMLNPRRTTLADMVDLFRACMR